MPIPTTMLEGRLVGDPQCNHFNHDLVEITIAIDERVQGGGRSDVERRKGFIRSLQDMG